MSGELRPQTESRLQLAIDLSERLFVLLLFATFAVRLSHTIILRPYNLIAILSEALVAYLIIVRRPSDIVTLRPLDWVAALIGTALPMFVRAGGQSMTSPAIGTTLMSAGLLLAIWAKISLRQSFGIAAANRGPVNRGPYRCIRHPMYAGYMIVYVGFFLTNPLVWNLGAYAAAILFQIARILAEEKILNLDPQYAAYLRQVRYRLLPGVF